MHIWGSRNPMWLLFREVCSVVDGGPDAHARSPAGNPALQPPAVAWSVPLTALGLGFLLGAGGAQARCEDEMSCLHELPCMKAWHGAVSQYESL